MTPDLAAVEIVILEKTNLFRRQNKLGELKRNALLDKAARAFARYLAKSGKFAHRADGRRPADRVKAAGYRFCLVAENLALNGDTRGFQSRSLAERAVTGWKNSPGHRRNMLMGAVSEIGIGVAKAPSEHRYLSVQLFARPESYKYRFSIRNEAREKVPYKFAGKAAALPARTVMTHTACLPAELSFRNIKVQGATATSQARFPAKDGDLFVIKQRGSKLTISHRPRVN